MLKPTNLIIAVLIFLIICCIALTSWCILKTPKIAYVRSSVVVENYLGMKEAKNRFGQKSESWNKNIDTLMVIYNHASNFLKENKSKLTPSAIKLAQEDIARKEENLKNYSSSVEKLAAEENEKLTQGALNQINSFVERFAKERHIDLVLGVTISGNILYGADKIDITKEVLDGLNKSYK